MRDTLIITAAVLIVAILLLATLRLEGGCSAFLDHPDHRRDGSAANNPAAPMM